MRNRILQVQCGTEHCSSWSAEQNNAVGVRIRRICYVHNSKIIGEQMASNSANGVAAARIGTRYQSRRQSAVSTANNGSNDVEIGGYLDRANQVEINVSRSETETQSMKSTGVSDKHRNRANKVEESFLDGIFGICKLHDEAFDTIFCLCSI